MKKPILGGNEMREEENPEDFFEQLVLPEGHKDLVKSLIAQHFRDKASDQYEGDQNDIVRGKGKLWQHICDLKPHNVPADSDT